MTDVCQLNSCVVAESDATAPRAMWGVAFMLEVGDDGGPVEYLSEHRNVDDFSPWFCCSEKQWAVGRHMHICQVPLVTVPSCEGSWEAPRAGRGIARVFGVHFLIFDHLRLSTLGPWLAHQKTLSVWCCQTWQL